MLLMLAVIMALTVIPLTAAASGSPAVINASRVNMRTGAGASFAVVKVLNKNDAVTVEGQSGNWSKIVAGNDTGYVYTKYVTTTGASTGGKAKAAVSNANSYTTLKYGMKGQEVVNLQLALRERNYLNANATGNFASLTLSAVKRFQADNGLAVDGIAGRQTLGALYGNAAAEAQIAPKAAAPAEAAAAPATSYKTLRFGMKGAEVTQLQQTLKDRGYFNTNVTGNFASITLDAVKCFQRDHGLVVDGIAGRQTLSALYNQAAATVNEDEIDNQIEHTQAVGAEAINGNVKCVDWFNGGNALFPRGVAVQVIDVRTGISYNVVRHGGNSHADVEAATAADTDAMYNTYGRSWSWDRRPILVVLNGEYIAASINGMPHGGDNLAGNGMNGMVCIHFLNSRTHGGNSRCAQHQSCVQEALAAGN
jgi:peptidoglycan hydrolase-like protein with peptidoglycan-binding domain